MRFVASQSCAVSLLARSLLTSEAARGTLWLLDGFDELPGAEATGTKGGRFIEGDSGIDRHGQLPGGKANGNVGTVAG